MNTQSPPIPELDVIAKRYKARSAKLDHRVVVCAGTGCMASGANQILDQLKSSFESRGLECCSVIQGDTQAKVQLSSSGCQGFCQMGPLLTVYPEQTFYTKVKASDVEEIVEAIAKHEVVPRLLYTDPNSGKQALSTEDIPFYKRQERTVLAACGQLDPHDLEQYIAAGGYEAARRAFVTLSPQVICQEILASGLRGRGGGGFPTGRKWALTLEQASEQKYIICNGDEGDPGAFMDRSLMEGNPHAVIEGMMIAGRAVGANHGVVYVRAEYPLAVQRVREAVKTAELAGLLGPKLFGTPNGFTIEVMEGAGAFVCGEETALIASVEGRRGMPAPKPPFPAVRGLYGKPTVINNVETLATIPQIIQHGASWFRGFGTPDSPGTKTFALTGHVANTGLIEVPFGTTLREIVYAIGAGVTNDQGEIQPDALKAVQIGGPSGGCLTPDQLDLPLDYTSLQQVGAMVGSGGLVVMNSSTCMVQVARFFMHFTQEESCGKCLLCREGTKQLLNLLDKIIEGEGTQETLDLLDEISQAVKLGSLCGLGKTAPNPVLSILERFRPELEAHVFQKRCPAGKCKALLMPTVIPEACRGCGLCAKKCPVDAITGQRKQPYIIDQDKCIRCGVCIEVCKFNAVTGG